MPDAAPSTTARILAAYQLGFVGGAPIGSFIVGYLAAAFGLKPAMLLPLAGMVAIWLIAFACSRLWYLEPLPVEVVAAGD